MPPALYVMFSRPIHNWSPHGSPGDAMLPGIRGSLVASAFLEDVLLHQLPVPSAHDQRPYGLLARWWRRVEASLGPASSPRAVLDVGALPLADLLGYDVFHIESHGIGFVGTIGVGSVPL